MVVVPRAAVPSEVVSHHSSVVDVGNVVISHFVPVFEEHMHTIIVTQEVGHSEGVGISEVLVFVEPVVWVGGGVL